MRPSERLTCSLQMRRLHALRIRQQLQGKRLSMQRVGFREAAAQAGEVAERRERRRALGGGHCGIARLQRAGRIEQRRGLGVAPESEVRAPDGAEKLGSGGRLAGEFTIDALDSFGEHLRHAQRIAAPRGKGIGPFEERGEDSAGRARAIALGVRHVGRCVGPVALRVRAVAFERQALALHDRVCHERQRRQWRARPTPPSRGDCDERAVRCARAATHVVPGSDIRPAPDAGLRAARPRLRTAPPRAARVT